MKRKILYCVILFIVFFSHETFPQRGLYRDINTTNAKIYHIKGKVKEIKQDVFSADTINGKIVQVKRIENNYSEIYNDKGNIIEKKIYKWGSGLYRTCSFKYNEAGRIIEENEFYAGGNGDNKVIYIYNEKGQLIEENHVSTNTGRHNNYIFHFDEKGNMILVNECSFIASKDFIDTLSLEFYNCSYDEKGKLIERCHYNSSGNLIQKDLWCFNEAGNQTLYCAFNNDSILYYKSICSNPDNGIIKRWESYSYNSDGTMHSIKKSNYDENFNIISENIFYSNEKWSGQKEPGNYIYKYEFDNQGNWIEKTEFLDEFPIRITIREIKYYVE